MYKILKSGLYELAHMQTEINNHLIDGWILDGDMKVVQSEDRHPVFIVCLCQPQDKGIKSK